MFYYILQVLVLQLIFLAFYDTLLRRLTAFNWNRFYLLATVVLSFVLPLVKFDFLSSSKVINQSLSPVIIGSHQLQKNLQETSVFSGSNVILIIYIIVSIFLSLLLFYKLYQIGVLIRKNKVINNRTIKIVLLPTGREVFSFYKYIFIDKTIYNQNNIPVIEHEMVHVKEKHWVDLLLMEVLKIVFWFSPFIWFYQQRLTALHEYIADKRVLLQYNFNQYFEELLNQSFGYRNISFINQFYKPSLLKKRILMQKRNTPKQQILIKYAIFGFILLGLMITVNACNKSETSNDNSTTETNQQEVENPVKTEIVTDKGADAEVAFQFIQNPPVYPGCEGKTGKELKDCMSKEIQKFVANNFNTNLASDLKLNGERIKILTMFTIDKSGKVTKIKARSKYPELADEAKRVIILLPQMKPGEQQGKPVNVTYTLPIIFKVEE